MRTRFAGTQLSSYLDPSNFDNISKQSMVGRVTERNADMIGKGEIKLADIMGDAKVKAAKYGASATVAQGAAKGQSAMFGGIADGIGSIASAFGQKALKNKPTPPPTPPPTGLNTGFNLGEGQAGLDPVVDRDRYLYSSPISSIPT